MTILEAISCLYNLFNRNSKLKSATILISEKQKVQLTKVFKNELNFKLTIGRINYRQKIILKKLKKCGSEINGSLVCCYNFPKNK